MKSSETPLQLRAHFDGRQIQLDEPYPLSQNTQLIVTVLPAPTTRQSTDPWSALSISELGRAYGADEPDYPTSSIKVPNPEYEGR